MAIDKDGWPVGEKRYHCANCSKTRGVDCNRKKRVGIGFCRDHSALKGNKETNSNEVNKQ